MKRSPGEIPWPECVRCGEPLLSGDCKLLDSRGESGRATGSAEKLEVCGRCYFACGIRRLARRAFPTATAEFEAVEALALCWGTLQKLRCPDIATSDDASEVNEQQVDESGGASSSGLQEKEATERGDEDELTRAFKNSERSNDEDSRPKPSKKSRQL